MKRKLDNMALQIAPLSQPSIIAIQIGPEYLQYDRQYSYFLQIRTQKKWSKDTAVLPVILQTSCESAASLYICDPTWLQSIGGITNRIEMYVPQTWALQGDNLKLLSVHSDYLEQ